MPSAIRLLVRTIPQAMDRILVTELGPVYVTPTSLVIMMGLARPQYSLLIPMRRMVPHR